MKSAPAVPLMEESRPGRPRIFIPGKEVKPAPVRPSREEGRKPISVPLSDGDIRAAPVVPPKQGEAPNLALATLKESLCWDVYPTERPTVGHLMDTLMIAAKEWRSKHGGFSTQDDDGWGQAFFDSEEESDSPTLSEPENYSLSTHLVHLIPSFVFT